MRKLLSMLPVVLLAVISYAQADHRLSDVNLYLKADLRVDSLFISNVTQDREFQFLPYSDTIRISFKDSINDLYTFSFYTEKGRVTSQFWLNGKNIIIKGEITNKLEVDTVIGSDLYHRALAFRNEYVQLLKKNPDSTIINRFLLINLKNNIGNPFSIEIANNFFRKNQADKTKLKEIYPLLESQPDAIRNHRINPYKIIDKIINEQKIVFYKYRFYDHKGNVSALTLAPEKKYLLDFWFTTCAPCISDHNRLKNEIKILSKKNIELVGISTDRDQKEWTEYLSKNRHDWADLRQAGSYQETLTTNLMINLFPTYILTDHQGNILYRTSSLDEMFRYIENPAE